MNKRGQYYLMVSMILVATVIGLISFGNESQSKPDSMIFQSGEELDIESEKVLDYSLNSGNDVMENFAENFYEYYGDEYNITYIIENEEGELNVSEYSSSGVTEKDYYEEDNIIKVPVDSINYTFERREGKDFYFIMIKESFGEKHVTTNAV